MTDATANPLARHTSSEAKSRLKRRYAREARFRMLGLSAIVLAIGFLAVLLASIVWQGYPAFFQHYVTLDIDFKADVIDPQGNRDRQVLSGANYTTLVRDALVEQFPGVSGRSERRALAGLVSTGAGFALRDTVLEDLSLIGTTQSVPVILSDTADLYLKQGQAMRELPGAGPVTPTGITGAIEIEAADGAFAPLVNDLSALQSAAGESTALTAALPSYLLYINDGVVDLTEVSAERVKGNVVIPLSSAEAAQEGRWRIKVQELPEARRQVSDAEIVWLESLKERGRIEQRLSAPFFFSGASREAELAGIWGAVVGSFFTMVVTLILAFPVGVAAAIYLEEFAPKNRFTDFIEVNISNLAAVPSIVFGLLGLAVFLNFFGVPRSAPVAGGIVLALMSLPTIIIASRAALKAVPPSIREAALGVGASKVQTVFHHVLPLALPGMLTGAIIGMAQALGETAPLLMIGMVAFIVDIPSGPFDAATVLPVQIYMWADFPEQAFAQKTAAAILVLLAFLILMNAIAVLLRKRFERRW